MGRSSVIDMLTHGPHCTSHEDENKIHVSRFGGRMRTLMSQISCKMIRLLKET